MIVCRISSGTEPGLEPYRTLRRTADQRDRRLVIAQGPTAVRALLRSRYRIHSLLADENWLEELRPLWRHRPEPFTAFVGESALVQELIGYRMYQKVMAAGVIPPLPTIEAILNPTSARRGRQPRLWIAIDGLSNAENLGALIRNAAAFRVDLVLVGETSASPFLRRAVRSSMGSVFFMKIVETDRLSDALRLAAEDGVRVIGAESGTDHVPILEADIDGDLCIVFGSEGSGISDPVLRACHQTVSIPTTDLVDSLNVASASAVFLHEAARQRSAG